MQHAQCVLLFLVLAESSSWFQILRSYTLLLKSPVLMCSCFSVASATNFKSETSTADVSTNASVFLHVGKWNFLAIYELTFVHEPLHLLLKNLMWRESRSDDTDDGKRPQCARSSLASFPGSHAPEREHWSCAGMEINIRVPGEPGNEARSSQSALVSDRTRSKLRTQRVTC